MALRFSNVADDVFLFVFSCSIIPGDGLYQWFNIKSAFIQKEWYRFPITSSKLQRAKEFDLL